jgi:hypothetical protein
MEVPKDEHGSHQWEEFMDTGSIFKLLYSFQIIESLIEEGGEAEEEIVKIYFEKKTKKDA